MKAELIGPNMGSDLDIVNAARVSFDKESEWEIVKETIIEEHPVYGDIEEEIERKVLSDRDKKLIKYLAKHNHFTPFTHTAIRMRETVPIFVARQRFKHVVGFTYNEVSRRYVDDVPEFYYPDVWRGRPEGSVKQGSGETVVTDMLFCNNVECFNIEVANAYQLAVESCVQTYESMIKAGVAPEQARMVLPQSMYTSYYVTGSLSAWARAYNLRIDGHAQLEIQELAKQWDKIIKPLFPVSWQALTGDT